MNLRSYLESNDIKDAVFARKIEVAQSTVLRLKRGERMPSIALARKIEAATDGAVPVAAWATPEASAA